MTKEKDNVINLLRAKLVALEMEIKNDVSAPGDC